jgi:DNA ligase-4
MDRTQLEVYNENIRMGRWRSKPFDRDDPLKRVSAGATLGGTM